MFKFAPLNWASSFLLSNILQPYFQGFDEKQVSLGLWEGELELNNLELKPDVLVMLDIDLEILHNKIDKIKIKIPWKHLRSEISIEGFSLCLKQCYQQNEKEKNDHLEKLQKLKEIALQKFDKEIQEKKNEQKNDKKEQKQGYFTSRLKDMLKNLQLRLKNVQLSYTRQINDFEIAKFGVQINEIVMEPMSEKKPVKTTLDLGYIFKQIQISGLQVYFDFYEQSQFEYLNLKRKESKEFLDESVLHLQDKSIFKEKDFFNEDIQVVKDFNIQCILKMRMQDEFEFDLGVSTSKIIRMLIKLINDVKWYRRDRPLISPLKEVFTQQELEQKKRNRRERQQISMFKKGVVDWWKYLIRRICEENRINQKIKFRHIDRIINDEVYKRLYITMNISTKNLPRRRRDFMKKYEQDNSLAQIIMMRQFALEKISQKTEGLSSNDQKEKATALEWFQKFDNQFQAKNIKSINKEVTRKKVIFQGEVKGSKKHIIFNLKIDSIEINVNENNMISDIKNLYNQVLLFKKELKKYPKLQKQVLNHLTKNFLSELSQKGNNLLKSEQQLGYANNLNILNQNNLNNFIDNLSQNEEEFISFNEQDMKSEHFKNFKQSPKKTQQQQHQKQAQKNEYLLRITIDTLRVQVDQQQNQNVLKIQFRQLEGIDLHNKNIHYSRFIYIPNGLKLFINSLIVQKYIKGDKSEEYENVVHNHIDFQADSLDFIFTKPFFERCKALHQLIVFNADKIFQSQKNLNQKLQEILFGKILQTQPKDSSKSNISINISRINIYFPINYQIRSDIFLIQLKNLKSYKREHDSLLVLQQKDAFTYHTENHKKNQAKEMITFFTSVDSLRLMFVKSYDWEEYENVFLVNYAKLNSNGRNQSMKESTKDQSYNFTANNLHTPQKNFQINSNQQNQQQQQQSDNQDKQKNQKPYVSILETLQIVVRIDQEDSEMQFDNFIYKTATQKIKDYRSVIYPHSFKISFDLPFLIFNLDLKQIHVLNYLASKWLLSGVNLFQAIKNQTLNGKEQKEGTQEEEQPTKKRKGNIFDKRESEQERYFNNQYNYKGEENEEEERDYVNNYDIQQDRIIDLLENFIVLRVKVNLNGVMLNLAINSQEAFQNNNIPQAATQSFHSNDLFAFYIKNVRFIFIEKVQEQQLSLVIDSIMLEQKNCYDILLKEPLAELSSKLLSQSDYAKLYAKQYIEKNHLQTKVLDQLNEDETNENVQQKPNLNSYNFKNHANQFNAISNNLHPNQAQGVKHQELFDEIAATKGFNNDQFEEIEDIQAIGEGISAIQDNDENIQQHQHFQLKKERVFIDQVKESFNESKKDDFPTNHQEKILKGYLNDGIYTKLKDYKHLSSKKCSYCFQNGRNSCGLILNFLNYPLQNNSQQTKDSLFNTMTQTQTPMKNNKSHTSLFQSNLQSKVGQEKEEKVEPDLRLNLKVFRNALRKQLSEESQKQFSEIDIQLKQTIFTMDPAMIQQIKLVVDSVSVFTKINISNFEQYMKWMGFWPDFYQEEKENIVEEENTKQTHPESSNELPSLNICAKTDGITLIFVHKKENIFLLNLEKFGFQMKSFQMLSKIEFFSQNVSFYETHDKIGAHSTVIESLKPEDPNTLQGEFIIYKNEQIVNIQKFRTYLGIKLTGVKVNFLKRSTYEIQLYIRSHILQALKRQLTEEDEDNISEKFKFRIIKFFNLPLIQEDKQGNIYQSDAKTLSSNQIPNSFLHSSKGVNDSQTSYQAKQNSSFRLELLILDSQAVGFRNSLSSDALYLHFEKLGMWTTGAWGIDEGELIETGLLKGENIKGADDLDFYEVTSNEQQQIYDWQKTRIQMGNGNDVIAEGEFEGQNSNPNELRSEESSHRSQSKNNSLSNIQGSQSNTDQTPQRSETHTQNQSGQTEESIDYPSIIQIKIKGVQFRMKEGKEMHDLFAIDPGRDWSIDLKILTDFKFNEENPGMSQDIDPLKIDIRINFLNIYLWDHDYKTVCKFFQENLGEQPQTVIPEQKIDLKNEQTWCFLDIRLNKTIAKIFQGEREDYIKYYHTNFCMKNIQLSNINCKCKENAIVNNEASVGELEIKDLVYRFYMQEYGGKIMKLYVGQINLDDNRKNSKIQGRKILYDLNLQEFNIFEEMSTFDQNAEENQNIIFQNIDEGNPGMDFSDQSDEMEIHEDFDQVEEIQEEHSKGDSGTDESRLKNKPKLTKQASSDKKGKKKSKEIKRSEELPKSPVNNEKSKKSKNQEKEEKQESPTKKKNEKLLNNSILKKDGNNQNKQIEGIGKQEGNVENGNQKQIEILKEQQPIENNAFKRFWIQLKQKMTCTCLRRKPKQNQQHEQLQQQTHQDEIQKVGGQAYLVNEVQHDTIQQRNNSNQEDIHNQIGSNQELVINENEKNVQFNSHIDNLLSERQDANVFGSEIKKKSSSISGDKTELNEDMIESDSIERDWPTDEYPLRKKRIDKLADTLKKTIPNPKSDYEDLQNEYDLLFKPHEKNKCDFRFIFRSRPDGEKLIKMIIENKTVYLGIDLISEVVAFFRKPYNGSDFQPNVKQSPYFNNFPQMTVEIKASNLMCFTKSDEGEPQQEKPAGQSKLITRQGSIFISNNYNFSSAQQNQNQGSKKAEKEPQNNANTNTGNTLAFFLDSKYTHKWKGDSYFGPGSVKITVDTDIKKAFLILPNQPNANGSPSYPRSSPSQRPNTTMNQQSLIKKKSVEYNTIAMIGNNLPYNLNNSRDSLLNVPQIPQQSKSKQPSKSQYYNPGLNHQSSSDSNLNIPNPLQNQVNQQSHSNIPLVSLNVPSQNQINFSNVNTNFNNLSTMPTTVQQFQNMSNNAAQNSTSFPLFTQQQLNLMQQTYPQNQIQTIVENVKIIFETTYEVDFIRKKDQASNRQYSSNPQVAIKEKLTQQKQFGLNQHSYRKTNITLANNKRNKNEHQSSVTTLAKLQKIIKNMMQPTMLPQAIPYVPRANNKPLDPFFDYNIQILTISVEKFHFEILKNNFGVKILSIKLDNLYAKKIQKLNNSIFGLKGMISIDYFNKRRITYEPLLEPWVFMIRQERIGSSHNLTIQNFESKKDENMLPLLKEHHNSFNLNFTLSCLETIMEAFRIYKGTMTDEEPYLIINKCGLPIEIKDSNKENSQPQELSNNQKTKWQGWKEVYGLKMQKHRIQQKVNETKALINLNIVNTVAANNNNGFLSVVSQLIGNNNNNNANNQIIGTNQELDQKVVDQMFTITNNTVQPSNFKKDKKNGIFDGLIQEISEEDKEKISPYAPQSELQNQLKNTNQKIQEGEDQNEAINGEENGRLNTQGSQTRNNLNLKLAVRQVSNVISKEQNGTQESYISNNNYQNQQGSYVNAQDVQGKLNSAQSMYGKQNFGTNKTSSNNILNQFNSNNNNLEDEINYSIENEEQKTNDRKSSPPQQPQIEKIQSFQSDQDKYQLNRAQTRKYTAENKQHFFGQNDENLIENRPRKSTDVQLGFQNKMNKQDLSDSTNLLENQRLNSMPYSPNQGLLSTMNSRSRKPTENKKLQITTHFNKTQVLSAIKNNLTQAQKNRQYLFRQIKRIQLDHVGKILIPLKLDKNELFEKKKAQENTQMMKAKNLQQLKKKNMRDAKNQKKDANIMNAFINNLNSLQKNINKLGQELINTLLNKKVNESGKTYLLVDNKLNPQTGSKEIMISSSVKFYNNLSRSIVIEFETELETGNQKKQNQFHIIDENSFFEVPLDQLEACAEVRLFPYLEQNGQPIPYDQINKYYEFVLLNSLIKDKTSYNDYDVDEEDIVSDILKDQVQGINVEKGSRLIFKEDYEVNPHIERNDQEKQQKLSPVKKQQAFINQQSQQQIKQISLNDLINFVVTCVKTKHPASYSLSEKEFGFETTLIINPIFKFVNATVNTINMLYGFNIPLKPSSARHHQQNKQQLQPKQIPPKSSLQCTSNFFSEDLQIVISYHLYRQTKELKIFSKKEQKYKIDLRLENYQKKSIILYLDVVKLSEKSREIVLFCPYLILNNSGFKELKFREFGLTTNIDSHQDEDEEQIFNRKARNNAPPTIHQKLTPTIKKNQMQIESDQKPISVQRVEQIQQEVRSQTKIESNQDIKSQVFNNKTDQDCIKQDINENEEEISRLKQLRMFSTSKTMNKIQIGMPTKDKERSNYSQPISLQATEGVFIIKDKNNRNQYEFGLTIESAPGFWSRSKIICITPRYMVRNESNYDLVLKQNRPSNTKDLIREECRLEGKLDNTKVSVMSFFWTDCKLPQECVIQLLGQRVTEEQGPVFKNAVTNKFRIDKVGDIAVKIKFDQELQNDDDYQYLKISIQLEENIFIISIMNEDKLNPPFFIDNQTKHEIYYGQHIEETKKLWCLRRKSKQMKQISTQVLYPGEKKKFTWDEWVVENDHILGVEIENETVYYNIDKIKDYPPIKIRESADELNKKKAINKKFLYKKGKIGLKQKAVDQYIIKFIILDVYQQKMKIYDEKKEVAGEVISLKGANIEDCRDQQFVMIKGNQHFYFDANSEKEAKEWTEYLWRAILLTTPDLVQFKIEPMERTKVLCFYQVKYEDEMNQQNDNQQGELNNDNLLLDNEEEDASENDKAQTTFIFKITNTVGISFIDNVPKEILQISFKNLSLIYSLSNEQEDKIRKNILDDIDNNPNFVQNNNITPNQNSIVGNTQLQANIGPGGNLQNSTINVNKDTQMVSMTQNLNQQSIMNNDVQQIENQKVVANQRALLSLQMDSIIINNQIENAQFPVLLAPTKRKTGDPFFIISILWKNHIQKGHEINKHQRNKLVQYIHQTSFYVDTIEIRIDDHILDTIISYFNQVRNILSLQNSGINFSEFKLYKYDELEERLSMMIENQMKNNQALNYIKNLRVEPIDICFTFRSSPGHSLTASTKNIIGDFGLTLASIDQAKIKLSQLLMTHIFGSIKDIFTKITKHFSQQFMRQLYKLLGSFDFLGNPVSLIENLGTSVVDMLYQPFYALVKGKSGYKFGEKFAIGAVNLISSSISGVYKTVNKIIGTIMKLLASMTLHKQFIHGRQIRLNRTIKNVKEGFIIGLKNFFFDIWQTITGIIRRPIAEAKNGGFFGLFKGLYQAFVSLFIVPTVAMYDLITTVIQGLQNTAQYEEHIMDTRSRPIRQFGDNKVLIPYEFKTAIGIDIIKRYKLKLFEHETVLFFDELIIKKGKKKNIESQIILSDIRIVYVKKHSSITYKKIMLHKIKKIQYEESNKKIKIKMHVPVKKVCVGQRYDIYLKYESKQRAQLLLDSILKYQNIQQIPQFDVKLD